MSDLYDRDILEWSEQQAALLRRVAKGERLHQRGSNQIDWLHIAEEIEDLGNEQRNAVESLLVNIMRHRLQIVAWPEASAVLHWQHEIDIWQVQVRRRLRRSPKLAAEMRDGLGELYPDALASMYREIDGVPRPRMPLLCPWTLDDLLTELS